MALVERLMGLADDGVTPDHAARIRVHDFFASIHQRVDGALTRQNVIDMFGLQADDLVDYDAVAALFPSGSTALATAQKAMFIEKIHSVFILAEGRYAGYETPAAVRTKLGI